MVTGTTWMPFLIWRILEILHRSYSGQRLPRLYRQNILSKAELNHTLFNICFFPPLFFFSSLFYTDFLSVLCVLFTYYFFLQKRRAAVVVTGLASLGFRQTNVFWVAVLLAGLEVRRTLPKGHPGIEFPRNPSLTDVLTGSWRHSCIYDPQISDAYLEGQLLHFRLLIKY